MTNREFQIALRSEIKQFKRDENYDTAIRRWATTKSHLAGLSSFMQKHPEIDNEQLTRLISFNPTSLRFLNNFIETLPNALDLLRTEDYLNLIEKYYALRKANIAQSKKSDKSIVR